MPHSWKKILVLGGDSLIGGALRRCLLACGEQVVATTRRPELAQEGWVRLDLAEGPGRDWTAPDGVGAAVICAGITGVEQCQQEPATTAALNVEAVAGLAEGLLSQGVRVLYLSSNQVFGGEVELPEVDHSCSAVNEYGKQKARAEQRILAGEGRGQAAILRLTKVLGPEAPLLQGWAREMAAGREVRPFQDMMFSPIPLSSTVWATYLLLRGRARGIYHLSGERDFSYAEACVLVARAIGADVGLVKPMPATRNKMAPFPARSAMGMERLKEDFGLCPPPVAWTITRAVTRPASLGWGRA